MNFLSAPGNGDVWLGLKRPKPGIPRGHRGNTEFFSPLLPGAGRGAFRWVSVSQEPVSVTTVSRVARTSSRGTHLGPSGFLLSSPGRGQWHPAQIPASRPGTFPSSSTCAPEQGLGSPHTLTTQPQSPPCLNTPETSWSKSVLPLSDTLPAFCK